MYLSPNSDEYSFKECGFLTVIAEIKVLPVGTAKTELSEYISKVIKSIKSSCEAQNLSWKLTSMSTEVEADSIDVIFDLIKKAHEVLFQENIMRVVTTITIDDRRDVSGSRIKQKVRSALNNID